MTLRTTFCPGVGGFCLSALAFSGSGVLESLPSLSSPSLSVGATTLSRDDLSEARRAAACACARRAVADAALSPPFSDNDRSSRLKAVSDAAEAEATRVPAAPLFSACSWAVCASDPIWDRFKPSAEIVRPNARCPDSAPDGPAVTMALPAVVPMTAPAAEEVWAERLLWELERDDSAAPGLPAAPASLARVPESD